MNCRLNAMQDSGIEEGVSLPEVLTQGDSVEIVGFVDGLGRKYRQCGDRYVRVRSFGDTKIGFPPAVAQIIDVAPLAADNEVETPIKDRVQLLLTGPESASTTASGLATEEQELTDETRQSQHQIDLEPSTVPSSEQGIGLHGD